MTDFVRVLVGSVLVAGGTIVPLAGESVEATVTPVGVSREFAKPVPSDYCKRRHYSRVVKVYKDGNDARILLRCGQKTWGFRHLGKRWNRLSPQGIVTAYSTGPVVSTAWQEAADPPGPGQCVIYEPI